MAYDDIITRDSPTTPDPFISDAIAGQIIKELPTSSALLASARKTRIPTKKTRVPVLSALPQAYWVAGDTGLKQTTKAEWKNQYLVAEELAAIIPVPDAYFDDAEFPIWDEVRPLIVEAIGKKIDDAGLFGVDKPASWPTAIYTGTMAAGNTVVAGTGDDLAVDVGSLGKIVRQDGFRVRGFVSAPGFQWDLINLRATDGAPIYQQNLQEGPAGRLYGFPLNEADNGAWDDSEALLIAGDWSKAVIGIRQDITFKIFTEGVITDDDNNIVLNLMQQDSKAMRVVMRVGFAVANPVTALNQNEATRYPFATLQATTAGS